MTEGGTATVTARVSPASDTAFTVTVSAAPGPSAESGDFALEGTTLSFAANATQSTGDVTVRTNDDSDDNGDRTVTVSGSVAASGVTAPPDRTLHIRDNDEAPTPAVTLVLTPDSIDEDGGISTVTATVSPPSPESFSVTVSAEAVLPANGEDFALEGTLLNFGADATESTGNVTIGAMNDDEDTLDKTVTVSGAVSIGSVAPPADATLTIRDDDTPPATVTLSTDVTEVGEGDGDRSVEVTGTLGEARPDVSTEIAVSVNSGEGEAGAVSGVDFAAVGDFKLTIPPGETAAAATFTLTPLEDGIDEPAETLRVAGTSPDIGVGVTGAAIVIADNDDAPSPVLTVDPPVIDEDGGTATVTVTTGEGSTYATAQAVTLTLSGTATRGSDYTVGETVLRLPAGSGNAPARVSTAIAAIDDVVFDPDEAVIVSGAIGQDAFGAPQTVAIDDDEDLPAVALVLTPGEVTEGGSATVTAEVTPVLDAPFDVTVSAAPGASAEADLFTLRGSMLSFGPREPRSSGTVTIETADDSDRNGERTVIVSGTVSAESLAAPADATLRVLDNDDPRPRQTPEVMLVLTPESIPERGGVSRVTATVSPASPVAFTVTVSARAVSPADGEDFTLEGALLSVAANATESTGEVTIAAADNTLDHPDRIVTISGAVSIDSVDAPAEATLTIVDDEPDVARGVEIVPTELTIREGEDNGGVYRVTLTAEPPEPVMVNVAVPAGSGLTVVPPRLRFTPIDWNVPQPVRVTAATGLGTGRVVRLGYSAAGAGYEAVPVAPVQVTVAQPPLPELRIADARGPETAGALVFELALNLAAEDTVTVRYATRDGTARAGRDYEAVRGTATIPAGELVSAIAVPLRVDVLSEPEETFVLELGDAYGAVLANDRATGVIEDDPAMASQWLARLGRLTGDHVARAVEEQIAAPRGGPAEVALGGLNLTAGGAPLRTLAGGFERFARARAGPASAPEPFGASGWPGAPAPSPRAGSCRRAPRYRPREPTAVSAARALPRAPSATSAPRNSWTTRRSGSPPAPAAGRAPRSGAAATTPASTRGGTPLRRSPASTTRARR